MPRRKPLTEAADAAGKRHALNMRTTREVREALEKAAAASGRSLVQEVEFRLEQSFVAGNILEKLFVGPDTFSFFYKTALWLQAEAQKRFSSNGDDWSSKADEKFEKELVDVFRQYVEFATQPNRPRTAEELRSSAAADEPDVPLPEGVRFETPEERAAGWASMLERNGVASEVDRDSSAPPLDAPVAKPKRTRKGKTAS